MKTVYEIMLVATVFGFFYFMLKEQPSLRDAVWMLAIRAGVEADLRRIERKHNFS